jgi:XTP/dITP diphosphohydrolase
VTDGKLSGRTMAELTLEEKGTISHRARAMEKLKKMLEENVL